MASEAQELKQFFEKLASRELSKTREKPVLVHVGKKSLMYRSTMARFKQLIKQAGSLERAKRIIQILFDAKELSWRSKVKVSDLIPIWDIGEAILKSMEEREKEEAERRAPFEQQADKEWEKLFGGGNG